MVIQKSESGVLILKQQFQKEKRRKWFEFVFLFKSMSYSKLNPLLRVLKRDKFGFSGSEGEKEPKNFHFPTVFV